VDEPKLADPDVTSGNDMQATAQSLAAAAEQEFRYAEIFVVAIVVTSVEVLIGCSMLAGLAMSRRLTRTLSRSARSPRGRDVSHYGDSIPTLLSEKLGSCMAESRRRARNQYGLLVHVTSSSIRDWGRDTFRLRGTANSSIRLA
jgi:hypothetical protein